MAKAFVILALVSSTLAIDSFGIDHKIGRLGGIGGAGWGYGETGKFEGLGVSKQFSSIGTGKGWPGVGGFGISKYFSTVGTGIRGTEGLGVNKQFSAVETSFGPGVGGVSKHISISAVGHGIGGIGGFSQTTSIKKHLGSNKRLGALGGLGKLGFVSLTSVNKLGVPSVATIPGGYYGGILAYPQAIPTSVSATSLHIPGAAVDTYRGYYAGYYPGSIGYGHSYRFFH